MTNEIKLTQKQFDCLFYIARGMTAKQIAGQMNISKRTVEFHIESLKRKMGCAKKTALIEKAWKVEKIRERLFLEC